MPQITSLPTATSVTHDDLVIIVDNPNGTPTAQKARVGDIVALAVATLGDTTNRGVWDIATAYVAGDVVSYDSNLYVALDSTTGDQPDTSPDDWQLWSAQGEPGAPGAPGDPGGPGVAGLPSSWDADIWAPGAYLKGTAIRHSDGNSYVAVVDTATSDPSTDHSGGGSWRWISSRGEQGVKPFTTVTEWVTATHYHVGDDTTPADAVFNVDSSYVCLEDHTSDVFADDLGLGYWQMIAAPGGLTGVQGSGGVAINNDNPTLPIVGFSTQVVTFNPSDVPSGTGGGVNTWGSFGGGDGAAGVTAADNNDYATAVEVARITVPGDSASTGDLAYSRRVELEASITTVFTADARVYFEWVRLSDSEELYPRATALLVSNSQDTTHWKTTIVRAISPEQDADDAETYALMAWVLSSGGGALWNFTDGGAGHFDVLTAKAVPV